MTRQGKKPTRTFDVGDMKDVTIEDVDSTADELIRSGRRENVRMDRISHRPKYFPKESPAGFAIPERDGPSWFQRLWRRMSRSRSEWLLP